MNTRDQSVAGPWSPMPGSSFNLLSHTKIEAPRPYVIALWLVLVLICVRLALLVSVVFLGWGWFPAPGYLPLNLPGHPENLFFAAMGVITCAMMCVDFTFGPGFMVAPDPPHGPSLPSFRLLGIGLLGGAFLPTFYLLMVLFFPPGIEMVVLFSLFLDPGFIAPSLIAGAYQWYGVRHHPPVERRLSPAAGCLRLFVDTSLRSLFVAILLVALVWGVVRYHGIGIPFW